MRDRICENQYLTPVTIDPLATSCPPCLPELAGESAKKKQSEVRLLKGMGYFWSLAK
jgi:hypothetical protein